VSPSFSSSYVEKRFKPPCASHLVGDEKRGSRKLILMDIDGTAFRKTLAVETLKRNPRLAAKLLLRRPQFYIYGLLYKLFQSDGLRRRFAEELKYIPAPEFDIKDMDPEYLKILRLAHWQGHKVVFLTSNPDNITKKWEERVRNFFPNLDFEVRSVATMEEKLRIANKLAEEQGRRNVYFFDDSLPLSTAFGSHFDALRMKMDKAVLLREHDAVARTMGERSQGPKGISNKREPTS